jgi:hypothetical protein
MNSRMRQVSTYVAVLLAGAATATLISVGVTGGSGDRPTFNVTRAQTSRVTDMSDDRRLVGFADNVFVGRVVSRQGQTMLRGLPETQWTVEVSKVYKNTSGLVAGTKLTVNQQGGYDERSNTLMLFDNDSLLAVEGDYLFATRTNKEHGWHTLVPVYGDLPLWNIKGAAALSDFDVRWQRAVSEQIPFTG